MSDTEQLSKRKRKAKESWSKASKKKKVDADHDAAIDPVSGNIVGQATKERKAVAQDPENSDVADDTKSQPSDTKKKRFILFVGNLSYKTSKADIEAHIKPTGVQPLSIRLQSDPITGKPKGFAFIDLPNFQSLDKVLNLHHSSLSGRKINVELTAGGGGKSESRKAKITHKNAKLDVERETAQKTKREAEAKKRSRKPTGNEQAEEPIHDDLENVDPSRRQRISKA